jgi:hypothetical protein
MSATGHLREVGGLGPKHVSSVIYFVTALVFFGGLAASFAAVFYLTVVRGRGFDHRLDFVRRGLTRGLQITVPQQEVRRGDELEAIVMVAGRRGLGELQAGIVCTESYDYESTWTDKDGMQQSSRETAQATAHEEWHQLESRSGTQNVRISIPVDAPFSYKGSCLSFQWEVLTRGRRRHRLDAQAARRVTVLP